MAVLRKALIQAHQYAEAVVRPGDRVVDATMGNGNDTLFLARLTGPGGKVYAFDIQEEAVRHTRQLLEDKDALDWCELIHDGHEHMDRYIAEPVKLVMFNLGYLPGGDHRINTRAETTIAAVEKSLALLRDDGLIIIVIYYGGDTGFEERDALLRYLSDLDPRRYSVMKTEFINQINCPPILVCVEKNV